MHNFKPNILIVLSGFSATGVGEQFLEAMLRGYEKDHTFRFSTVTSPVADMNLHGYKSICKTVPHSKYPILLHRALARFDKQGVPECVSDIQKLIQSEAIDIIWIFMNSWYTIQIAGALADHLTIPLVTHVWDAPEYLAKKSFATGGMRKRLMRSFEKAMTAATAGVTVSKGMTSEYQFRYGLESSPMVFCPPKDTWRQPQRHERAEIKVVFAGSLYAYAQWNAFLDAIEYNNKQTGRTPVRVTCIGNTSRWARQRKWVRYEPLKPIDEAATAVNDADIAYLPYWMSKSHAHFVKMAFPGKMSFYATSGTPVFFHGPVESSPTDFLQTYGIGVACHTNDAADILSTIDLLQSERFRKVYVQNRMQTLEEVFHPERCSEVFRDTIDRVLDTPNA